MASQVLPFYYCASYAGETYSKDTLYVTTVGYDKFAIRNYAGMGATTVGKIYKQPDGVFYAMSRTRIADVRDGTSMTIFIVETREPNAAVWIDGGVGSVTGRAYLETNPPEYAADVSGLNKTPYFNVTANQGIDCEWGPSSMHYQSVNHLFGDGAVKPISEVIETRIYDRLVTRMGGEKIDSSDF